MTQYNVLLSDRASEDMDGIYDYIANTLLEPVIAANQYDRIARAILTLEKMPERIRLMDSQPERSKGLRPLIVDNYTVFFVIQSNTVRVVRVLYSSSDIKKRLLDE